MKNLKFNILFLLSAFVFVMSSCDDDEPIIVDPVEIITTLNMELTESTSGETASFSFRDPDGDGGGAPTINTSPLKANSTYTGTVEFLNEAADPTEDVTEEIQEEDAEHQVFYSSTVAGLTVATTDTDGAGNPLGLKFTLTTGDAGTGTLTVTLRHEPDKTAAGVSDGDITNAGGETDIEVSFDVTVQ